MIVYAEFVVEAENLRLQDSDELEAMRREIQGAIRNLPAMAGTGVQVRVGEREYTSPPERSVSALRGAPRAAER